MKELIEKQKFVTDAYSSQGVCFDGTHYYVSDNDKLYKYDDCGDKVTERDCTSDGTNHHLGSLCVVSGVLYVTSSDYPNTPYNQYVKEYNASDLSYRNTEYFINENFVGEGIDHDGSNFWTVSNNNVIQKWESGFTNPVTYTVDIDPVKTFTSPHQWQGMKFYDGSLYLNPHEGAYPPVMQRYELDGTVFKLKEHIHRPKWCSQGFDIVDDKFILAGRGYGQSSKLANEDDSIVITQLEPDDGRDKIVAYREYFPQLSTTSGAYTEISQIESQIYARKWDIVQVKYHGNFKVTSGNLRAYIRHSAGNQTSLTQLMNAFSIRTADTTAEGELLIQIREFLILEEGIVKFAPYWKRNSGSGTAYVQDQTMILRIIGRYTD